MPPTDHEKLRAEFTPIRPIVLRAMKAILAFLGDELAGGRIATRQSTWPVRQGGGTWSLEREFTLDFGWALVMASERVAELDEVKELVDATLELRSRGHLLSEADGALGVAAPSSTFEDYIVPLMQRYCSKNGATYEESLALHAWAELEAFLEGAPVTHLVVGPLLGAGSASEEGTLDELTRVRRLTGEELRQLWGHTDWGLVPKFDWYHLEFCIERRQQVNPDDVARMQESSNEIGRALRALRLAGAGDVGVVCELHHTLEPVFGRNLGFHEFATGRHSSGMGAADYVITRAKCNAAAPIFHQLKVIETRPVPTGRAEREQLTALRLGLDRFNSSYERTQPEDRLIDYWIALEALALRQEDELSYRVSLRLAYYLGTDPDERETIFAQLRSSYDARSRIVHGTAVPLVREICDATSELLRRALAKVVLDPSSLDLAALDRAVARGS
jgi:hypothetical protein